MARGSRGAVLSVAWALGPVLRISVLHPVGLLKGLVGGSAATVTVKINACKIVFCPYHEYHGPHTGHTCSCVALVPPQRQQAKAVVSVRGRLGAPALGKPMFQAISADLCIPQCTCGHSTHYNLKQTDIPAWNIPMLLL